MRHHPLFTGLASLFLFGCPAGGDTSSGNDPTGSEAGETSGSPTGPGTATTTAEPTSAGPTTAPPSTTADSVTTVDTGTDSDTNTETGEVGMPLFEPDIVPIFNKSCGAGDNACHSRVAYSADAKSECRGWLALEDASLGANYYAGPDSGKPTGCPDIELYDRLMQLDAWQCETFDPRMRYVVPCKPEASYVFQKINGGPFCAQDSGGMPLPSQAMPLGKVMDTKEIATIKAWIEAGAPRIDDPGVDCEAPPDPGPQDPVAQINHPGDGETRKVGVDIPFIGLANDPQDGVIPGASLVWTSDLDGQIGTGTDFSAPLNTVGVHTVTLTATDIDGNEGTASLKLNME